MKARIIQPIERTSLRLPRIGKIKIGEKTDKGYPRSVDYFIATGDYASHFNEVYPHSNRITIAFLSDDPNDSCRERLIYYNDQGKVCARGDGESYEVWNEVDKKYIILTLKERPKLMEEIATKWPTKYGWTHELTMNFLLPKVRSVVGFWQFTTKGKQSTIPQIVGAFDAVLEIRGAVKLIPFDLVVNFAKSMHPGEVSRYPVVSLVPNAGIENTQIMQSFGNNKALSQ